MGMNADAGVWIDGGEIWVVSADGRYVRHAPVPGDASPRGRVAAGAAEARGQEGGEGKPAAMGRFTAIGA